MYFVAGAVLLLTLALVACWLRLGGPQRSIRWRRCAQIISVCPVFIFKGIFFAMNQQASGNQHWAESLPNAPAPRCL